MLDALLQQELGTVPEFAAFATVDDLSREIARLADAHPAGPVDRKSVV